ncbi:MAG: hypothetical protein U5R31_08865 [Acidimicrobiia bacterium]|nr:hypothetical protein [Acidimicrobiia bacterium]
MAILLPVLVVLTPQPAGSGITATLEGVVESGGDPLEGYDVTLYATDGNDTPIELGVDTTAADGSFAVDHLQPDDPESVLYLLARSGDLTPEPDAVTLATVLGPAPLSDTATVNPRTTVATAYAMAQFLDDAEIRGEAPGVPNAAGMSHNVANPATGDIGDVLNTAPNGSETNARKTFNSLANMVAACVADPAACDALRTAGTPTGGEEPADSLQALRNVVHDPGRNTGDLFAVSELGPQPYDPARAVVPAAWTIALRFDGDGTSMSGPGNFTIDHEGNVWVANNYVYSADRDHPVCGSNQVMKFTPTGEYVPGSPFSGGGLAGVGYGIDRDRYGHIWLSNFGFAAQECTDQPAHNSVSEFAPDGTPISPDASGDTPAEAGGYIVGGIDWPQGTNFDRDGDLWIANCNGNSVSVLPDGDPDRAYEMDDLGVRKPFDVDFDLDGNTYVTGTESDNLAIIGPDGNPLPDSPIGGFHRPMGIASNSQGELWVANSGLVDLPCPTKNVEVEPPPSVSLVRDGGASVTTFEGGGVFIPWGIEVDGNDNVWVSNFGGKRLTAFCGRQDSPHCPEGVGLGDPLSPDVTGFAFDGLTRSTAVAIDPSGNVWATNNWKEIPTEQNPGGYEVVAFLGLAGPVVPPPPEPEPDPQPEPAPVQPIIPATPVATEPSFTG